MHYKLLETMDLRIKDICKEKKITQKDLAVQLGITNIGLSQQVNGNPTVETLQKIANALNVDVWELFTSSSNKDELTALIDYKGELHRFNDIEALREFIEDL